jgi:hypothetical protein
MMLLAIDVTNEVFPDDRQRATPPGVAASEFLTFGR